MIRHLLYSHDSYGLGHVRRSALIAAGLVGADRCNEALIVTGSPAASAFGLPARVETIKLPTVTKDAAGRYRPRQLGGALEPLVELRSNLICAAVESYRPDVVVIDHAPLGVGGELRRMLDLVERLPTRPRLVLGLRDIIDDAGHVEATWRRDGIWQALERYDDILVYGDPRVLSTAAEIDLAGRSSARVTHTGYVAPRMPAPADDEPFLLVTAGGGGDGLQLIHRFLCAVERGATADLRSIVVTGPLLDASSRAELLTRAALLPTVELVEFTDRMRSLVASAAGVISMAGYNTVVEQLAAGVPALLVPRRRPRLEQHLRATRLAPVTPLEHCPLERFDDTSVRRFVHRCRSDTERRAEAALDLELGGVAATVSHLTAHTRAHASDLARSRSHV